MIRISPLASVFTLLEGEIFLSRTFSSYQKERANTVPSKPNLQQLMENYHPEFNIDASVKASINILCGKKQTSDLHDLDRYHLLATARLWLHDGDRAEDEPGLLAILQLLGVDSHIAVDDIDVLLASVKSSLSTGAW